MLDFLKGPDFSVAAFKGQRLTCATGICSCASRSCWSTDAWSSRFRRRKVSCIRSRNSIRSASIGRKPNASCTDDGEIAHVASLPAFRTGRLARGRDARCAPSSPMCRTRRATPSRSSTPTTGPSPRPSRSASGRAASSSRRDGKFVLVAVGDDDTIQVIDTATQQVVDTLPSGPGPGTVRPGCRRQDPLRRQRERQHGHDHRSRKARPPRRRPGRRRARGHGASARTARS